MRTPLTRFTLLFGLLVAACSPDPRTQITFVVDASSAVAVGTTNVRTRFFDTNGTMLSESTNPSPAWPLTFAVYREEQDEFVVEIVASSGSGTTVARTTSRVAFARGKTKLFYVELVAQKSPCAALSCAIATVCDTSVYPAACTPVASVDGAALPDAPRGADALVSPCDDTVCSGGQSCSVVQGTPTCACAFPTAGPGCGGCATGWVAGVGGECVPACESSCGAHAFCEAGYDEPRCECALGYVDSGSGCVWIGGGSNGGGIRDGNLVDPGQWTTQSTTFDPDLFSPTDGGATFSNFALCGSAYMRQTFDMPSQALAEPFLLEITVRSNDTNFLGDSLVRARIGDTLIPIDYTGGATRVGTSCLGAGAYGLGRTLEIIPDPNGNHAVCQQGGSGSVKPPVTIDRVRIIPTTTATCPSPGVRDGSFSTPGTPDWSFTASLNGAGGSSSGASGAAVLVNTQHCQSATVSQRITLPTATEVPNPAIKFTFNGTAGVPIQTTLTAGNTNDPNDYIDYLGSFVGTGVVSNATVCIPPSMQGTTRTLLFALDNLSGLCATAIARTVTVDDVQIASDPACAGATSMLDGTFEFGVGTGGFRMFADDTPATAPFVRALGGMIGTAHAGAGLFSVDNGGVVGNVLTYFFLDLPRDSDPATGPQLRFFYRTSNAAVTPYLLAGYVAPPQLTATTNWTEYTQCIDADLEGHRIQMPLAFNQMSAGASVHYIDDVTVVESTACP